jgi:hypothetical protein
MPITHILPLYWRKESDLQTPTQQARASGFTCLALLVEDDPDYHRCAGLWGFQPTNPGALTGFLRYHERNAVRRYAAAAGQVLESRRF